MKIKETLQTEAEKLRSMSKKDRIWYIWEYYKFHILGILLAFIMLFNIGAALYRSTFDTVLHCYFLNSQSPELNLASAEEGFASYAGLNEKQLLTLESGSASFDASAGELEYAVLAKITALVMSHDLDIIIGDTASANHYASLNGFADLETILPEDLSARLKDRFYYAKDMDGAEFAFAIDLSDTEFARRTGLLQDSPLLSVIAGSERKEMATAFIRYIFQ